MMQPSLNAHGQQTDRRIVVLLILMAFLVLLMMITSLNVSGVQAQETFDRPGIELMSATGNGVAGNSPSYFPAISGDGRFVVFQSEASNLVAGDTNYAIDIFLRDRLTNTTNRVSVSPTGAQGSESRWPTISADGSTIAFLSRATFLAGDTNGTWDAFVYDRSSGQLERVSAATGGAGYDTVPSLSADGRYVTFTGYQIPANTVFQQLYRYDRQTQTLALVSASSAGVPANDYTTTASLSGNGQLVAFTSFGANLVAGDTNYQSDIFVRDMNSGVTRRITLSPSGEQTNDFSSSAVFSQDGRYVVYLSGARNLVAVDNNLYYDIFRYDLQTNTTVRVSVTESGAQAIYGGWGRPSVSADGRFIAFWTISENLVPGAISSFGNIVIKDMETREVLLVTSTCDHWLGYIAYGFGSGAEISADGRYITFRSNGDENTTVDGNSMADVYAIDVASLPERQLTPLPTLTPTPTPTPTRTPTRVPTATLDPNVTPTATLRPDMTLTPGAVNRTGIELLSQSSAGQGANGSSVTPAISRDGRYVVFESYANNLVPNQRTTSGDIFVRDRELNTTSLVYLDSSQRVGVRATNPSISPDGRYLGLLTSEHYDPDDASGHTNFYLHDRLSGYTRWLNLGLVADQWSGRIAFSEDNRFLALAGFPADDTTHLSQVFRYELATGTLTLISANSGGQPGNRRSMQPQLSPDGRYALFTSYADDLVPQDTNGSADIFLRDLETGETQRVSVGSSEAQGYGNSSEPSMSDDGRYVTFLSEADELVRDLYISHPHVFVRDLETGQTSAVSIGFDGNPADDDSYAPSISGDGRYIVFWSKAQNLINGYAAPEGGSYLFDRETGEIRLIQANVRSHLRYNILQAEISGDGDSIVFQSNQEDLVEGDTNLETDLFAIDRVTALAAPRIPDGAPTESPVIIAPDDLDTDDPQPIFSWEPVPDADYYEVRLSSHPQPNNVVYSGTDTHFQPENPLLGTAYYWRVRAVLTSGMWTPWSEVSRVTILSPENEVPELQVVNSGDPTLTWTEISWGRGYWVEVDDSPDFNSPEFVASDLSKSTLSVHVSPPLSNGTYYWRVRAKRSNGTWGGWSQVGSFVVNAV